MGDPQVTVNMDTTGSEPRGVRLERAREAPGPSLLPSDIIDQIRGRLRLVALLLFVAFMFDPLIWLVRWGTGNLADAALNDWLQLAGLAAGIASAGLWWIAGDPRLSPPRLLSLGLVYEVVVCYAISLTDTWQHYLNHHLVPNLDWVPAVVIFFPLVLPGPPRRMLLAAIASALMTPLAIFTLAQSGQVVASLENYFNAGVHSAFAVVFAYMGSRVVYGLGREVVRARELGSYQLGELLGRGGMGEVYRATHRLLARPAAIKLIRPESLAGGNGEEALLALKRFRREAEVAASLRSPHTVELYDFGITEDQTFYFVMELLDGMDLESLVRQQGPVPAPRVIYILRQVCESLGEAHARGLVHRDIKPANIHIGQLGLQHDFVKVLDFGLVKSVVGEHGEQSLATGAGLTPGTPGYLAPEMAFGEAFDGRADLYSLGCVAYYLLTGQLVFEAANGLQMIAKHMREAPVPPSARTELPVPPALERLVLACLAKRPADRPASATGLSRSLDEVDVERWGEAEAEQWWSRHAPRNMAPAIR
jgi:eukaryotic-like serine/threonine-protein kinase